LLVTSSGEAQVAVRGRVKAVAAGAVLVVGAGLWAAWPESPAAAVVSALQEPEECPDGGGCVGPLYETLDEALPNIRFRSPHFEEGAASDLVLLGRFTNVRAGRGFAALDSETPTSFDDPEAIYGTAHARFAIDDPIAGEIEGAAITVGFRVRPKEDSAWQGLPTFDVLERGLPELGRVVLVVDESPGFEPDLGTHQLVGGLLVGIDEDGTVSLPLLPNENESRLLEQTPTLDSLRDAATAPTRVIELDSLGERID
jgi:hypothetical protein